MPSTDRMLDTHTGTPLSYDPGWEAGSEFGFSFDMRQDIYDTAGKVDFLMHCLKTGYSFNLAAAGVLKYKDEDFYKQAVQAAIRYDRRVWQAPDTYSLWLGGIATFYHDKYVGIDSRETAGAGPRFLFVTKDLQNDLSIFLVPELTNYSSGTEYDTRLSFRNTTSFTLGAGAGLVLDAYFVPSLEDMADFRTDVSVALNVGTWDWMKVGIKLSHGYDTKYQEVGIGPHDLTGLATLAFTAKRSSGE